MNPLWSDLTLPAIRRELLFGDRVVHTFAARAAHVSALLQAAACAHGEQQALIDGEFQLNWSQLQAQVQRLAGGLRAQGIVPGDRVVIWLSNRQEFVLAWTAVLWCGAIAVPVSVRETGDGLAYVLNQCAARGLITESSQWPLCQDLPSVKALCLRTQVDASAEPAADDVQWHALLAAAPLSDPHPVAEADVATILYTSGTTGKPKGAMLTHVNIVHSCMHFAAVMALGAQDRTLLAVPASHVTGLIANIATMIAVGGAIIVQREFKAGDFLALAARAGMTHTLMVPAMYKLLLMHADFAQTDLSAWRVGGYGGAPMPVSTIDALAQALPRLMLHNTYGATETTSPTTTVPRGMTRDHIDSVGIPLPCARVAVMDDDGREVAPGEMGEIWISGPMVVKGYWDNPEATAKEFSAGWWHSGDLGSMDAQGFVRVFDRKKDMLNRGGYKIYSIEVENHLMGLAGVLEAAVVAKPCPVLGERVHVFIHAPAASLSLSDVQTHCAKALADYKVPESVSWCPTPLPRNPNGKVLKRVLREQLLKELGLAD